MSHVPKRIAVFDRCKPPSPAILEVLSSLEFERNAAFHDRLAPHYDSHLSGIAANSLARTAFQELVVRHVPTGATLLDFGCGTGIDALAYARHGYRVLAYDNSPGMVEQLRGRCQAEIAAGAVTAYSMSYPAFLENLTTWPAIDAVTANFAPGAREMSRTAAADRQWRCKEYGGIVITSGMLSTASEGLVPRQKLRRLEAGLLKPRTSAADFAKPAHRRRPAIHPRSSRRRR